MRYMVTGLPSWAAWIWTLCTEKRRRIFTAAVCRCWNAPPRGGGGYALGTGISVADYLPFDHYMAILQAARDF